MLGGRGCVEAFLLGDVGENAVGTGWGEGGGRVLQVVVVQDYALVFEGLVAGMLVLYFLSNLLLL